MCSCLTSKKYSLSNHVWEKGTYKTSSTMETVKDIAINGTRISAVEIPVVSQPMVLKVYKRRLWMLILFSFLSMLCGMIFPMYVVMADVTRCFYGVSTDAVDWTSLIFMVVYVILVFPASSLINYMDLRWTVICTAFFNTVACAIEFATLTPTSYAWVMVSAFFGSVSNIFGLGIPPFLAAMWFPSHELSRACAFGVFGNQLGVALGFIFSPLMVPSNCEDKDSISSGKRNVAIIQTAVNAVVLILVVFTFQNAPKVPPSLAQAEKKNEVPESHSRVVWKMMRNVDFILIFVMYGLMVGTYFALSTTLNNLILSYFPGKEVEVGWMGLLLIVSGLVGSLIAGYILDWTHRFKEVSLGICIGSLVTNIIFSYLLLVSEIWVIFLTITIYGFFLTSFLPIGFEYGIEVTYPQSEAVCACLLNASTMLFGIILTELTSQILTKFGPIYSNAALTANLLLCCIITTFITREYKRSKQNQAAQKAIAS